MEHSTSSAQTVTPTAAPALRAQLEQLQRLYRLSQEIVTRDRLTTLMVTHSMQQATNLGDRLVMMHHGQVIHDFRGAEKERLRADDLLNRFEEVRRSDQLDESAAEMLERLYV